MRLQRYLAQCGVSSRRKAEVLITEGHVRVNGEVITELGTKVDPDQVQVEVDGKPLVKPENHEYWMLHKPTGVVTTMSDPEGRCTVTDLMPTDRRVVPVGRLDFNSSGLLLLTDDGELALRLTHPRWGVEKEYLATVRGEPWEKRLRALREGVDIGDERPAQFVSLELARGFGDPKRGHTRWLATVHEGRNRLVRRMFAAVGHPVAALHRTRVGPLSLGRMPMGRSRELTEKELTALRSAVGLTDGEESE